jgi:hypothetical protein
MPAAATTTAPKKSAAQKKPLTKAVAIQRREAAEKRVLKLEGKLAKDKELVQRYVDAIARAEKEAGEEAMKQEEKQDL